MSREKKYRNLMIPIPEAWLDRLHHVAADRRQKMTAMLRPLLERASRGIGLDPVPVAEQSDADSKLIMGGE